MESYGELLKNAREVKNLDFDTVARETSIASQYLVGLEEEDSSAFPGEPYMLGFLRNYADYLGLDPEMLFKLYRSKKLQESPVPEGLIVRKKSKAFWALLIFGIVIAVGLLAGLAAFFIVRTKKSADDEVILDKNAAAKKYELGDRAFNGRLYVGDQIIFPAADGDIILTVSHTLSSFGLQTPVGTLHTELAEEAELDIDGDAAPDLIVYVSDISMTDSARGAEVRFLKRTDGSYSAADRQNAIPLASEIASSHKQVVIFEDNRAYPFTLNGTFRKECVFRYKIDRRDSIESYYSNGEIITMTANNGIRLWMSNCNAVKFQVIADSKTYDLEIGKAGQVLAEDIKWIRDTDGKYKLVVIELD
ncbi:MAG: helix-turn-helix domain-containing protein [Treponemataceae bacterium]|nr:helix-turn-helix domain-containing protein [Treponemataceae bacterium]